MAEEAEKEGSSKAAAGGGGQMKLVIVGAVAVFAAVLGAQVAAPLINGAIHGAPAAASGGEHGADEEGTGEEGHEEAAHLEPALYAALDPPFVVSFDQEDGTRYLQLTLQAMARSEAKIAAIKQHAPAIRNSFLFLLSGYKLDELATQDGKEHLRVAMLDAAKEMLKKNTGEEQIEDLYFTSLVIQ